MNWFSKEHSLTLIFIMIHNSFVKNQKQHSRIQLNCAIKWPWEYHSYAYHLLAHPISSFILLSTNWKKTPFSTISETCFHISLQFLKLTLIFSTNSISLRFWELDFTGKYFSTISETCFHLSTISETHFHLSTISISLQIWTHP